MNEAADLQRLRSAFASLAEDAQTRPDCPDPDRIWRAVRAEPGPQETAGIVAHIAACPVCAESWRIAIELGAAPRSARAAPRPRRWVRWGAFAASLAAASLAVFVATRPPAPPPTYRDGEVAVLRSVVPEDRALRRAECLLRWTGGPPRARYSITVVTETLEPVARAQGLDRPEYRLSQHALRSIPAGGRLLWRVEALAEDGSRYASATFVARVE